MEFILVFACCHIVPNLFYVSFLRLAFFNQPTFTHCTLHGSTIHILERQIISSGYLNSQLQLQSEFLRPQKLTTTHSTGKSFSKRTNPFCSEQRKQDLKMKGGKSSFFIPLKHRTATDRDRREAAATATRCTPTLPFKPTTGSPCPQSPFISSFRLSSLVISVFHKPDRQNPQCPLSKHFFLPVRTLSSYTHLHRCKQASTHPARIACSCKATLVFL